MKTLVLWKYIEDNILLIIYIITDPVTGKEPSRRDVLGPFEEKGSEGVLRHGLRLPAPNHFWSNTSSLAAFMMRYRVLASSRLGRGIGGRIVGARDETPDPGGDPVSDVPP
jgi:hypothetical protein